MQSKISISENVFFSSLQIEPHLAMNHISNLSTLKIQIFQLVLRVNTRDFTVFTYDIFVDIFFISHIKSIFNIYYTYLKKWSDWFLIAMFVTFLSFQIYKSLLITLNLIRSANVS